MRTGISTACLYPMETEKSLDVLLKAGYRLFEVFLNAEMELEKTFLRGLLSQAKEYGASFVSVHPFTSVEESLYLFSDYSRRTREGFERYQRYMEAAAFLGGKYVVIHGQLKGHGALSDEEYWERFGELTRFGRDTGACPAQEIVRQHRSSDLGFLRGMREYLGNDCAFVLDTKQCKVSGLSVERVAAAMGNRLCHVHLSDCTEEQSCLLPGDGTFDFVSFRHMLDDMDYRGKMVTEVYRSNFNSEKELEKARQFTENVFEH